MLLTIFTFGLRMMGVWCSLCHPSVVVTGGCLLHFPAVFVNRCWNRVMSPAGRWLASVSVIDCGVRARIRQRGCGTCSFGLVSLFSDGCRPWRTACSALELRLAVEGHRTQIVPRLLAVIWFHTTRLETRTKESNMCASLWVIETRRHNESKGCLQLK